jgi:hypothetical protein
VITSESRSTQSARMNRHTGPPRRASLIITAAPSFVRYRTPKPA